MRDGLNKRFSTILSLCLAIFATLGVLFAAYGFTPSIAQTVGPHDAFVFRDFFDLEKLDGTPYRWGSGQSRITLPQTGQAANGLLTLNLLAPDSQNTMPLTLAMRDQPLVTLPIRGQRTVSMLVPDESIGGDLRVSLNSPTLTPPTDKRALGVGVARAFWTQLDWSLPPLRQLWTLPGLVLALGLLLLRLGRSPLLAAGVAGTLGVGLALGAGLLPLQVAPYTHRILVMLLLAHSALLLWTALTRPEQRWWRLPDRVEMTLLILLLGIGYWMFLPYQRFLCLDSGGQVCPRLGTQNIGIVVLTILLALALLPRLATSTRWKIALLALAIGGVAEAAYAARFSFRRSGPDFFILWRAAYDFHLGRPLYKMTDVLTNHFGHVFKVPPFYGMLFLPIADATDAQYNMALAAHRAMNLLLYASTGGLLAWMLRPRFGWLLALATIGVIMGLMQPPFDTIAYGQIDIVLLLLLTITLLGLRGERSWLVGLGIALGTLFKLYPFLLVGFLFVRREWKAIGWVAAWLALLNGIALGVMGWENHVIYVTQVLPNIGGGTSWVENQTINGFINRLSYDPLRTEPVRGLSISLLTYGSFALVAGSSLLLALAPFKRQSSSYALQFSIFSVVMVLAVPAAWMHYSTVTILAFVTLAWHSADHPLPLSKAVLLALAFGLIAYGNQWSFFDGTQNPGLPFLALSYKFYGLVLLWSLIAHTLWNAWAIRREHTQRSPAAHSLVSSPS